MGGMVATRRPATQRDLQALDARLAESPRAQCPLCVPTGSLAERIAFDERARTSSEEGNMHMDQASHPFRLLPARSRLRPLLAPIERILALDELERRYGRLPPSRDALEFIERALAELQVPDAQLHQGVHGPVDLGVRRKHRGRICRRHAEHVADAQVLEAYVERTGLEASARAAVAGAHDVGHEAHFVNDDALALANRAAATLGRVEGEACGTKAQYLGFGQLGVQLSDLVPDAQKRGGHGPGRAPDG